MARFAEFLRETDALRAWVGGSVLKDKHGQPIRFFRGQRRVPSSTKFVTTQGRATPSFTPLPAVANVYAGDPNYGGQYRQGANVGVYYLKMEKPLDLRHLGEQATLEEIIGELNWDWRRAAGHNTFNVEDLLDLLYGLDRLQDKTAFHFDINVNMNDTFDELRDTVERWSNNAKIDDDTLGQKIENMLYDVTVDVYAVVDTPEFTEVLRRLGYDGAIHKDVFDIGIKYYQGPEGDIEQGHSSDHVIDSYRPFYQRNIKSATGNRGTYDPNSDDVTEGRNPYL